MRQLNWNEINFVGGGDGDQEAENANTCANSMMAAGGMLAIVGGLFGGIVGSIFPVVGTAMGAAAGSAIGALAGGGYVAENGEACQNPGGESSD